MGFEIAKPNEALIVSGKKGEGDGGAEAQQYRIVPSGKRVWIWPMLQSAQRLALDLNQTLVPVTCVTKQGIRVQIEGVVAFKVASNNDAISNAAQRFLHDPSSMRDRVHEIFAGHIRGIVGSLTIEELIRDRESLTNTALDATAGDMQKMGLTIDSLQIAEIKDPTGYIDNLSKPDIARVNMDASKAEALADLETRKAQADANRQASQAEQENETQVAAAKRDTDVKRAAMQAEIDKAKAESAQAGPLAEAEAQKEVVQRETEVAQLRAAQREQQLVSEIIKPAEAQRRQREIEAEADKVTAVKQAEAEAEARRVQAVAEAGAIEQTGAAQAKSNEAKGRADAAVIQAKGEAEGKALEARASGLATESEAVIAQMLAEKAPEIVKAAASAFDNVDSMTILNGAQGVMEALTSISATAGKAFQAARGELSPGDGEHTNGAKVPVGAAQE